MGYPCGMPNLYHSDLHLPRWKRVVLWLLESPAGQVITGITAGLLVGLPIYFLGWYWAVGPLCLGIGFAIGWNAARRYLIKHGELPKV